jgi:hypothetical protein
VGLIPQYADADLSRAAAAAKVAFYDVAWPAVAATGCCGERH